MKIVGMLFTIKPQIPLFSHYCWCYNLYEPEIFILIGQTLFFLGIISFKLKENFIVNIIFRFFFTVKHITWNLIHIPNKTLPDMTRYRMPLHICESLD